MPHMQHTKLVSIFNKRIVIVDAFILDTVAFIPSPAVYCDFNFRWANRTMACIIQIQCLQIVVAYSKEKYSILNKQVRSTPNRCEFVSNKWRALVRPSLAHSFKNERYRNSQRIQYESRCFSMTACMTVTFLFLEKKSLEKKTAIASCYC